MHLSMRCMAVSLLLAVLCVPVGGQTGFDRNGIRRRHRYTAVHINATGAGACTNIDAHLVPGTDADNTTNNPAADDARALLQGVANVWLYGLVLANYDPAHLLEHFLSHYLTTLGT